MLRVQQCKVSLCLIWHVVQLKTGHAEHVLNIKVTSGDIDYPTWQLLTFIYVAVMLLLNMIV